jgi:ferredoxin/flavodoxin---NADP+ reductase
MLPTSDAENGVSLFRVAVVGSGPSGFYAAEALMRGRPNVQIDMFDRLPTPFGLVRGGVAPDHPKIKQVILVYDKIAKSPGFAFYGNVNVGVDLTLAELKSAYHAVVFASGANTDRRLGIPGEDLPGSHTATEFVGWYNGHPDYRDCSFDFSHESAIVIGQGNVAADVARILATPLDELRRTDIAEHAVERLSQSRIRDIYIIGRRGPAQAKFTSVELKELGKISDCEAIVAAADLELNPASAAEIADIRSDENRKNIEIFRTYCINRGHKQRRIHFRFLETPVRISKAADSGALALTLAKNTLAGPAFTQVAHPTSALSELRCGLVFRSVGYRGMPIAELEFDETTGTVRHDQGRCLRNSRPIPGVYVTGWIKRGATGIIGTNRADSVETVASIVEDLPALAATPKSDCIRSKLAERNIRIIEYADWLKIDLLEKQRGQLKGKPREKFTSISDMIAACEAIV